MSCTVCIGAKERCEARPRIFCTYFRVNRDLTRRFVPKYHHFAPSKVTRSHVPKVQQYKIIIFYFLLLDKLYFSTGVSYCNAYYIHWYIYHLTVLLHKLCIQCMHYSMHKVHIYIYIYIIYGTYVACNVAVW